MSTLFIQSSKLTLQDVEYPELLKEISAPPKQLYCLGDLPKGPAIAIIGSRKPTSYGEEVTYQLAFELAQAGLTIVSGLALGLDAVAHRAALDAKGSTIAVLAHGLDLPVYPATNQKLAARIIDNGGAVLSEYDPGMPPLRQNFVARNRIESGLSLGVVVTEAASASGTLLTANFALEQNRIVMAVPGNITSILSAGPNNLLRSGATPVTSSSDVLAALGYEHNELQTKPPKADSAEEALILKLLDAGVTSNQALIEQSHLNAAQFAHVISLMEITGKVRNLGAGQWTINRRAK